MATRTLKDIGFSRKALAAVGGIAALILSVGVIDVMTTKAEATLQDGAYCVNAIYNTGDKPGKFKGTHGHGCGEGAEARLDAPMVSCTTASSMLTSRATLDWAPVPGADSYTLKLKSESREYDVPLLSSTSIAVDSGFLQTIDGSLTIDGVRPLYLEIRAVSNGEKVIKSPASAVVSLRVQVQPGLFANVSCV